MISRARRCILVVFAVCLTILVSSLLLVLHKAAPPNVTIDPKAAERLQVQVRQANAPGVSGRTVELDESELNLIARSTLERIRASTKTQRDGQIRELVFKLLGDRVRAYLTFIVEGKELSFDIEGELHSSDGFIVFDPTSGRLGAMPIPRATLKGVLKQMMASPQGRQAMRLPDTLVNLRITDSKLVVVYK